MNIPPIANRERELDYSRRTSSIYFKDENNLIVQFYWNRHALSSFAANRSNVLTGGMENKQCYLIPNANSTQIRLNHCNIFEP